jgi:hypothetical protein
VTARREAVECACFGTLGSSTISVSTVIRNGVLTVVALVVVLTAHQGAVPQLMALDSGSVAIYFGGVALALACVLVAVLTTRRRGEPARVSRATERPVPDLEITAADGRATELVDLPARVALSSHPGSLPRPVLLVLLSAECTPCSALAGELPGWARSLDGTVSLAVLTSASREAFARSYPTLDLPVFYGYRALMVAEGIRGVPSALLISTNRTIAAGPAEGIDEVRDLAAAILSVAGQHTG